MVSWENKNIIIVEHEANDVGPGHVLEKYFLDHDAQRLLYIGHPNLYIKKGFEKSSRAVLTEKGKQEIRWSAPFFRLPEWLLYVKDTFFTIYWLLRQPSQFDLFIGLGNINALCGVVLQKLGKVKKVVYYVIDYIPERFKNPILNTIYAYAERFAALLSDSTWNLSPRMIEGRNKRWNKNFKHQLVVPHGLYFDAKKIVPYVKLHKHELIYMGNLNKEQGIQLVIDSMPKLQKAIPDIAFTIIGTGNYENELKKLVKKLHVSRSVRFLGPMPDNQKMEHRLGQAAIAVAMYDPNHSFSYYSDPGKIKHYLSVGLPVVMTGIPAVAKDIEKKQCGIIIPYDGSRFIQVVSRLFKHEARLKIMKGNAVLFAKQFDWNYVFDTALSFL